MKNFFQYLGSFLFWFFSSIGAIAITPEGITFILGIFIVVMSLYIFHLVRSEAENKLQIIATSTTGLFGGIIAVAQLNLINQ
ncbi:membrane hypothetical protein [Hyella patelloides LEGE 07179]|uniref:Uncharacterized protein n=1 Tax=Hyella patelloides LEGE 07179 TaxID=945734 RepID=A0A563VNV1_9CYAN|nr:hypothetical protein [Hyella patelloides]VEP13103.1 membrane hypothetical protein [Hyella patelloides LEGE 07179]